MQLEIRGRKLVRRTYGRTSDNFVRQQRFVNDVSHELRTPLTIIRGYVDILERYGADDPELFREAVSSIKTSAQNMQSLVENLLFFARADQDNQPMIKVPVDLDEVLKNFVEAYRSPRVHITKLAPCKILADAEFLKRMFTAFLENALQYSAPDKPVTIELTTSDDAPRSIEVRVEKLQTEIFKEVTQMQTTFTVEGMMCKHCVKHVHDALAKMDGVTAVDVSLEKNSATVTATKDIPLDDFAKVIADAGYELIGN